MNNHRKPARRSFSGPKKQGDFRKANGKTQDRKFSSRFSGDEKKSSGPQKPKRNSFSDNSEKRFGKKSVEKPYKKKITSDREEKRTARKERKSFYTKTDKRSPDKRSFSDKENKPDRSFGEKPFKQRGRDEKPFRQREDKPFFKKSDNHKRNYKKDYSKKKVQTPTHAENGLTRLNKYIANAGICSRREADDLISTGCITVNGKVVTELGYKLKEGDKVMYSGVPIKTEKLVYLLLNKPKDYITTTEDDRGRKTVMELVENAGKERIYPVGRLDRNTTGLLLFTNDGEMAKKLTHPKHQVNKLYHVELDKNVKSSDFDKLATGIELEDGFIKPDALSYVAGNKREVGIQIHSGRNRVVRRMFEHLGYDVIKLDRVMFAGLTKKDISRGRWRFLTEKEIAFLKMV